MDQLKLPADVPGARFLRDTGANAWYCEYCERIVYFPAWCYAKEVGKYPACQDCLEEEIAEQIKKSGEAMAMLKEEVEEAEAWETYISNITGELT